MDKAKEASATASAASAAGLRGVVAASSSIGDVNGEKGELIYQGINIHDLAKNSTFEEVVFLLWNGRLPKRAELDELKRNIAANLGTSAGDSRPDAPIPARRRADGRAPHGRLRARFL